MSCELTDLVLSEGGGADSLKKLGNDALCLSLWFLFMKLFSIPRIYP
jgi:hypothetical protein